MNLATFVYKQYLQSTGIQKRVWLLIRKLLISVLNDPICSLMVHGHQLKLPLSHALPIYLIAHPHYDRLPQRVSKYIHQTQEQLNLVDIGANIGDTIAAFYLTESDTLLAIEPNPKFNTLLVANFGSQKKATIISDICSSKDDEGIFVIRELGGTASIQATGSGTKMQRYTLDTIVRSYDYCADINVIKIDTDGYDFEIIKGASKLISTNQPVVLFECDSAENIDYVADCLEALSSFKRCGYNFFLLYDNFGYLIGKYSLSDLSEFKKLVFYQLVSKFYYFDILVMNDKDISAFHELEVAYFTDALTNKSMQQNVALAVDF